MFIPVLPSADATRSIARSQQEQKAMQVRLEVKSVAEDGRFAGYASVFDLVDNQRDIVLRGAFRDTIKDRTHEIKLLWQHEPDELIGYITELFEDEHGLYMEGALMLELARAREAHALLKQGVVSGLSIGYSPLRYQLDPDSGVRRLSKVALWEVSLVTFPANEASRVSVVKAAKPGMSALIAALERAESVVRSFPR